MAFLTDEELAQLQNQMYHDMIDAPKEQEEELISTARTVSQTLYFGTRRRADFEFLGHRYIVTYVTVELVDFRKVMKFVMDDLTAKQRIHATAELNNGLSEIENIRATIAAMLRSHIDGLEVGEVEEE